MVVLDFGPAEAVDGSSNSIANTRNAENSRHHQDLVIYYFCTI
jgi:hypothetical protein